MNWAVLIDVGRTAGFVNLAVIPFGVAAQVTFFRAVPGTRLRYIAKSVYTAFLVTQTIICPLMLLGYIASGDTFWSIVYVIVVALNIYNLHIHRKYSGDDDDFWKGLGGRIKKLLTRPLHVLRPVTH